MPQVPIARETVVLEIGRQLGNWNIETHQNGRVTLFQGGFDFNVGGARTILAPDVAFTPSQTTRGLDALQNWTFQVFDDRFRNEFFAPGTTVELGFLVSIGQDENNQLVGNIHSWRWDENSDTVRHYEHGWRNMNTTVNGQQILPGFILDVEMIEEAISQQDSGSSSSDDDTRFTCPKCAETFTDNHKFMKIFKKSMRYQINALINRLSRVSNVVKKKLYFLMCSSKMYEL
ncbi:unnamed protein product [Rhizophagus irregularis]|nr:unnamed protein product [Rhizophagus irregularis]